MVMTLVKNNFRPVSFNSVFNELFNDFPAAFADKAGLNFPPVNIAETADGYHVELNAPGRNKEDFKIRPGRFPKRFRGAEIRAYRD